MTPSNLPYNQLLRLSFSDEVVWLSGPAEAARPVTWVTSSIAEARPGDLLLLSAATVTPATLAEALAKTPAGLLFVGRPQPALDLPPDLPAAWLARTEEVRSAQRLLTTQLVNQRAALMERGVRIHAQLAQLAAEGGGLDGLARMIGEITGRGVVVQDKRLRIQAEYPAPSLLTIWDDLILQLMDIESLPESLRDRKEAGRRSGLLEQTLPGSLGRLIIPISVGEVARGYLSLVGLAGEFDALDHLAAEQGVMVCAVEMARAKAVREAEKRLKGDLLMALLEGELSPRDAQLWVQTMGLNLEAVHVALRFAWDGPAPPSRRRLETLVNGEVSRQGLRVIVSAMGAEVTCFCEAGGERPSAALTLAAAVVEQERKEYPAVQLRCGIGGPARDLNEWRASFRQAGQALDMARRLNERQPLYFPDLSVYRLLLQIEHNPELSAFQEEILGALLAYEGADELIHTLEAYFTHHANLSQTAEALFVHRNTLIYRMERITAITGWDLDRPDTRLAVQLALRILRMRG